MIIVYTQFHKYSLKFLPEFIKSANKEDTKTLKVKFIINFNQVSLKKKELSLLKNLKFEKETYFTNSSQHKARLNVLNKIKKKNFHFMIFIDSDDLFYRNRIMKINKIIKDYDFIVNNLKIFKNGKILNNWIRHKNKNISLEDIDDKNFIGLSNLTITKKVLIAMMKKKFNLNLIAFDWIFIKSIIINNFQGYFDKDIFTLYRKYSSNVIKDKKNYLNLKKVLNEKLHHYKYFQKDILSYDSKIDQINKLNKRLDDKKFRNKFLTEYKKLDAYWWQLPPVNIQKRKKIMFISGSRSEFNIINNLFIKSQDQFDSKIIIHAGHMQSTYGNSYVSASSKKFHNKTFFLKTNIGKSNSKKVISSSFSKQILSIGNILRSEKPDFSVIPGDRTEALAAACASLINQVPIIHLHGGELSFGSLDEKIRHSISKMSSYHFCSTLKYKNRLIQLGEDEKTIKMIGAPSLHNYKSIKNKNLKEKKFLEINNLRKNKFLLVGLNSCLTKLETKIISIKLFEYLDTLPEIKLVTYPNPDLYNDEIIREINKRQKRSDYKIKKFLGSDYFIALKNCKFLIGNSSSGIIEAPFFNKIFINLGTRQYGREYSKTTTINIKNFDQISQIINKEIKFKLQNKSNNLYYNKHCQKIFIESLSNIDLDKIKFKQFIDN